MFGKFTSRLLSNCTFKTNKGICINFIPPNMILTKDLNETTLNRNCKDLNISIILNNLLTINNCGVKIRSIEFECKINNPLLKIIIILEIIY